jgi:hypothetical protein
MATIFDSPVNSAAMAAKNPDNFQPNLGNIRYRVDNYVYIFSVARRDFSVSQTLFPKMILKGCEPTQRWCLAAQIADPIPQASPDLERGGARTDFHDGWRAAIGLLHPENTTPDPWANAESSGLSVGTNLIAQGLWPSLIEIPSEEDIQKAESLRNRRYKRLTDQAMAAARQSSKKLADFLAEHEDVADAMDAQHLTADWHHSKKIYSLCPNCGDEIAAGMAFHRSTAGVLCILDPERAFKAGAIDKARLKELTLQVA